ncbi:hypothetical protein EJB05_02479, partial [Eragrostis curvula]
MALKSQPLSQSDTRDPVVIGTPNPYPLLSSSSVHGEPPRRSSPRDAMMQQPQPGMAPSPPPRPHPRKPQYGAPPPQQPQPPAKWGQPPPQAQYGQAPPPQQYYAMPQALAPAAPVSSDEVRTLWIGDLQYWMDENSISNCFLPTGPRSNSSHW